MNSLQKSTKFVGRESRKVDRVLIFSALGVVWVSLRKIEHVRQYSALGKLLAWKFEEDILDLNLGSQRHDLGRMVVKLT